MNTDSFINIICIIIVIIVSYQLNNVLGKRTGPSRPQKDPFASGADLQNEKSYQEETVLALPSNVDSDRNIAQEIEAVAPKESVLYEKLYAISELDKQFRIKDFMQGAHAAYEMILSAFAKGEYSVLEPLVDKEIFEDFSDAIRAREEREEQVQFTFVAINKSKIIDAQLLDAGVNGDKEALISVCFNSEVISSVYDKNGTLIEGDDKKILYIQDRWTFARVVNSPNPNWRLVATQGNDDVVLS